MKKFKYFNNIPKDFTGSCTILDYQISIAYFVNGKPHNEYSYAIIYDDGIKAWYYKGNFYGNNDFTNESWQQFVENKKREEELQIFK